MKHAGGDGGGATRALLLSMLFSCDVDDTSLSLSKHRPDSAGMIRR
jgi:hypothetical protein